MSRFEDFLEGTTLQVVKKLYKTPTKIQSEVIPLVLAHHDVVAMSKTGSGKTAAFLLPIVQLLGQHSTITGCRALIVSPNRELALQTARFFKKYSENTNLKIASLIGGEPLPPQFDSLTLNPDVIIGTPGRILHIVAETQYSLERVQYFVLDEADLLFESGFEPQVTGILKLLPEKHQTLLFSATVPTLLAEFTRINLSKAIVKRIDLTQLPSTLELEFLYVNPLFKPGLLIKMIKGFKSVLAFVATKHHAEYLSAILKEMSISSACVYGVMDQDERNSSLAAFARGALKVLFVTDVVARGLDIEGLDLVVNYDFPDTPKVFLHRSGRAGRAGRKGNVISLITQDELPYYCGARDSLEEPGCKWDLRRVYSSEVDSYSSQIDDVLKRNHDIVVLKKGMEDGEKMYIKSRKAAKPQWLTEAKDINIEAGNDATQEVLNSWRPKRTIFEQVAAKVSQKKAIRELRQSTVGHLKNESYIKDIPQEYEIENSEAITAEYEPSEKPKRKERIAAPKKKIEAPSKSKFFLEYRPDSEDASSIRSGGAPSLIGSVLDITPDDQTGLRIKRQVSMYKKKIGANDKLIKAMETNQQSFIASATAQLTGKNPKGEKYQEWVSNSHRRIQKAGEEEKIVKGKNRAFVKGGKKAKSEIKTAQQIEKEKLIKLKHKLNDAGKHKEARALNLQIFQKSKK